VVRCTGAPVQVTVSGASPGASFSVNGSTVSNGSTTPVPLSAGQGLTVSVSLERSAAQGYYVRCLPSTFPSYTVQASATVAPEAGYYLVAPTFGGTSTDRYVAIFDSHGVPVWWWETTAPYKPVDAKLVTNPATGQPNVLLTESDSPNPDVGYTAEQVDLDGNVVDGMIGPLAYNGQAFVPNPHEVQLLNNGDYLVLGTYSRCCYNLASMGGPASASIRDDVIQEVDPATGTLVWDWDAADHVGLSEVNSQWYSTITTGGSPYDVFHMNSAVASSSGDVLVSLRYADAVYYIEDPGDGSAGAGSVIWKLGGSQVPNSLTVQGDPVFQNGDHFGGQHYARFYDAGDGNTYVTLHDNGTAQGRAPRGVEYKIEGGTAQFVQQVTDSSDPGLRSPCCGSVTLLSGGDWVVSWGGNPLLEELTAQGARVLVVQFGLGIYSYRAQPILPGQLSIGALRQAMDTLYG